MQSLPTDQLLHIILFVLTYLGQIRMYARSQGCQINTSNSNFRFLGTADNFFDMNHRGGGKNKKQDKKQKINFRRHKMIWSNKKKREKIRWNEWKKVRKRAYISLFSYPFSSVLWYMASSESSSKTTTSSSSFFFSHLHVHRILIWTCAYLCSDES